MIYSVKITNPKGEALELELTNPEKSGLIVRRIEGLGPPKANINGQELANTDGMVYTSSRADTRNIVFTLRMFARDKKSKYGRLSIEESRHLTYRYFPLKKQITMSFKTDTRTVYTTGYVESNEPDVFSSEEEATISVICPDPYFYEDGRGETIFAGIQPEFEFPFSNESVTENLIEMGSIWIDTQAVIEYNGTVDTGVLIKIHVYNEAENIRIINVDTREWIVIDTDMIRKITGHKIKTGDDIFISTVKNDRYCRLLRDGAYINIIGCMSRDSDWFQISQGKNAFVFTADGGEENLSVTFSYSNAYVGV